MIHMAPAVLGPTPQPLVFTTKFLHLSPARSSEPSRNHRESQGSLFAAKKINELSKTFSWHGNVIRPEKNDNTGGFLKFGCSFL